ncbi:MAG: DUF4434 domain-containing protein [Petrotogaceae bacterium]|nr:DUF4434 domain-containing protein [Petrotogaceae bacterium]
MENGYASYGEDFWEAELKSMKEIGMDSIIIQYTKTQKDCFFNSTYSNCKIVNTIIRIAEKYSLKIFLGLGLFNFNYDSGFDLDTEIQININLFRQLNGIFKESPSLAGWYIPHELDDRNFNSLYAKKKVYKFFSTVSDFIHTNSSLPVMISPYFGINPDSRSYSAWWNEFFKYSVIDILAMQDGVGTKKVDYISASMVFKDLEDTMKKNNVEFWADIEVFEAVHGYPIDLQPWQAKYADFERVKKQLEYISPYVSKSVIFDYPHYFSPRLKNGLYENYQNLLKGGTL